MADAQAQAPVIVRAEALRDVLQAVVPGDAAALLELRRARQEIELVVHHQDLGGRDLEESREHLHRMPARVHEALRQHQPGTVAGEPPHQRLVLAVLAQRHARLHGEALHQPEAGVVARAFVLLAWISQADNEPDRPGAYGFGQDLLLLFLLGRVSARLAALLAGLVARFLALLRARRGTLVPRLPV